MFSKMVKVLRKEGKSLHTYWSHLVPLHLFVQYTTTEISKFYIESPLLFEFNTGVLWAGAYQVIIAVFADVSLSKHREQGFFISLRGWEYILEHAPRWAPSFSSKMTACFWCEGLIIVIIHMS